MVASGFPASVLQAQSIFRAILDALARPGTVHALSEGRDAPNPFSPGAAAVALALCDHDTPVWLDGGLRENEAVGEWLRFHCGCPLVTDAREAIFAFASAAADLPPFDAFNPGTNDYPDRSTTIVLAVETFEAGAPLTLMGPGIRGRALLRAMPLPADMAERLVCNRLLFPRGIDLLLVTANAVVGLPRSVRIVED
jgi:alpha-D-ribose 1-methylphosphonate 5-triphosphate synthase subunit PhnH